MLVFQAERPQEAAVLRDGCAYVMADYELFLRVATEL
jgi:hypothetical protein